MRRFDFTPLSRNDNGISMLRTRTANPFIATNF